MTGQEAEKYLFCAMTIGEQLLISGAEISRVEDTIKRICLAYEAERVDVFTITSSIVTTIYSPVFGVCTQTRRISETNSDFERITQLNALSRKICEDTPPAEKIEAEIQKILETPRYSPKAQFFIYALISGIFSAFFGGTLRDMLVSACIGIFLRAEENLLKKISRNRFLSVFLCSCAGGLLANISVLLHLGENADKISIGNIMLFIPGLSFTNAIRDMFSGDTISGILKLVESLILAVMIAGGFAIMILLFHGGIL